jgi:hypothetical protein
MMTLTRHQINPVTTEYRDADGNRVALVRCFNNGRAFASGLLLGTRKTFHHEITGISSDTNDIPNIQRMMGELESALGAS